jgi:hypothetical protein
VHPNLEELLPSGSSSYGPTGGEEWVELGPNGTYVAQCEYYHTMIRLGCFSSNIRMEEHRLRQALLLMRRTCYL